VQLGLADLTLGEGDGDLADVETAGHGTPGQVDLEDVAGVGELVEVEGLDDGTTVGAVAGGHVGETGAEHEGDVDVAALGQDPALLRPVHDLAARYVAGADDEFGAVVDLVEEQVQLLRGVGAVGVHLAEDSVVTLEAPLEAGDVRAAQATLALAVEDVDVGVGGGQLIRLLTGAVGAVVVDDEDVDLRGGGADSADDQREVLQR